MNKIINDIKDALQSSKPKTSAYDSTAEIVRIENGTAWVHIPGGVDETPVKLTMNAKQGDTVQVRVSGGRAWLTGNASAPPTDDTTAIKADTNALRAKDIADSAFNYAESAADAAGRAITSATQAASAAASAQTSANNAQTSANNAAEYASRALGGLSTVQSVAETLTWITQHGTMTLTTDVALDPTHVYFVLDPAGDYTVGGNTYAIVTEPNVNDIGTYYELTIDESLNNYVGTHLALTGEGLWLLPASSGTNKVLVATGAGTTYTTAGTYIIDSSGKTVASFRADGATINGPNNVLIAHLGYGSGASYSGTSTAPYYTFGTRASGSTIGNYSVAEGLDVTASGYCSHAEGGHAPGETGTTASARFSHAEGTSTASANGAHAEGNTTASGIWSHSEGYDSTASGNYSHTQNLGTIANQEAQTAIGKYNTNTLGALIVGNGTADNARSNAFVVSWNGDVSAYGDMNIASGKKYQINGVNLSASDVGAVPTSRTVNSKALSSNITLSASDVGALASSSVADYITSKGTSGSWYYEKYASGKIEAVFHGSVTYGTMSASGQLYRSTNNAVAIPSGIFAATPQRTEITINNASTVVVCATAVASSSTNVNVQVWRSTNAASSIDATIRCIYVP